jgi:hypothetical protein
MQDNKSIFRKFNNDLNNDIISSSAFQRARASGRTERSLLNDSNVDIEELKFTKRAVDYLVEGTDTGRGKTNNSGNGSVLMGVYDWLGLKKYGIDYQSDKERLGIAYAIAATIHKKGSYKHRNESERTTVVKDAIQTNLKKLIKDLAVNYKVNILKSIRNYGDNVNK